jgi:peptide/nickel transport system substrate-binding protein
MDQPHERPHARTAFYSGVLVWLLVLAASAASCTRHQGPAAARSDSVLRVGVGGLPLQAPQAGVQQVVANLSFEGLINFNEDGRPRPFLAERWTTSPDGRTLTVHLHARARFHDDTPVTAAAVVPILESVLPRAMGSAFEDIAEIKVVNELDIELRLRQPAPLVIEALETTIRKPGKNPASVGPYMVASSSGPLELTASKGYYQGRPAIDRIVVHSYPSVRAAWAELLRGGLDMLYEVDADALDSLQSSSGVAVFSFLRHYQYVIMFTPQSPALRSAEIRRELNAVIDRDALVQEGLNGHGLASSGPVSPRHWALGADAPKLAFDPVLAERLQNRRLQFTCLVPADSVYERVALTVKRQLAAASVDMKVQEAPQDQLVAAAAQNNVDAVLVDVISGPGLFRLYQRWHSGSPFDLKSMGSPLMDSALDAIRHAASDDEYRRGVRAFQDAVVEDPPAIFLAWGERARAVSRRFEVPLPEDGRDALATLRLWHPAGAKQMASN